MSLLSRIRKLFSSGKTETRKVPILGVEGSGKSSLIVTLGQYISLHEMGSVLESESGTLFGHYLQYVMAGKPFPATTRWDKFSLRVEKVPEEDGTSTHVNVSISSEDIPGIEFRRLVDELRQNPNLGSRLVAKPSESIKRFTDLLSECDGFIFIIDLVRDQKPGQTYTKEQIWAAFADQIQPIMTGLLLSMKMNTSLAYKPVFFVFSKPDLHGLTSEEIEEYFERGMAIPLAQLRRALVNVRHYNVQCAGWEMDSELGKMGVGDLVSDLVHAVGGVRLK